MAQVDELIAAYIKVRNKKTSLKAAHDAEIGKYNAALAKLETALLARMNEVGTDSFKGDTGTAFKATRSTAKVVNRDEFLAFVRDNDAWDLLEARAAKTSVDSYLEEHEELPPGVVIDRATTINVRSPS